MATQSGQDRIGRTLLGGACGLLASFAFALGLSVKACLPEHPEMISTLTFEFFFVGFVIYLPAVIVGFLIGHFTQLKALLIMGAVLLVAAFGVGYGLAHDGCVPL